MANPRIMIAAPKSGSGKTLIVTSLLEALCKRNLKVSSFKCGPDYIDSLFHEKVLGVKAKNLDLYFTDEETTKALFLADNESDISIIEGVMGLYDGIGGVTEVASSYHLASALNAPIILVINARGMGRSVIAEIKGFKAMDRNNLIRGVILNQTSEGFYNSIKDIIELETGVCVVGYYPVVKGLEIDSRYLGLKLPDEISGLHNKISEAAIFLERSVDITKIISFANSCGDLGINGSMSELLCNNCQTDTLVNIAVAKDSAFCFYYKDNLELLESLGARITFFSPLKDKELPNDMDGLILGGGYPELMARELSQNTSMLESIRNALDSGLPSLAECGGFMYLHDHIENESGECFKMVGAVKGTCRYTGKLVRFGYAEFEGNGMKLRGHEFHYYDSDDPGSDYKATKPVNGKSWKCMYGSDNHLWGYGHLYYYSNVEFAKWFIKACINGRTRKNG